MIAGGAVGFGVHRRFVFRIELPLNASNGHVDTKGQSDMATYIAINTRRSAYSPNQCDGTADGSVKDGDE